MPDGDLMKLYSQEILRLAASIPHLGRLADPHGSAMVRAPLCGSVVTADVRLADGRIAEFAQDVKACALGQAAASAVGGVVLNCNRDQIATARAELAAMLTENGPAPAAPFDKLGMLVVARDYRNRHASILLALDATLAAIDAAKVEA